MLRRLVLACALLLAGAGLTPAFAAPAQELSATETVKIAAPPDKIWGIIQNFGDITWLPLVKGSTATNGNNIGSVRTLDLGGGAKVLEQLTRYKAAKLSYSYKFTDDPGNVKVVPVTQYRSTISVKTDPAGTLVTWRGWFHRADPSDTPAAGQDDAASDKAIRSIYRAGLDNLKKVAEGK